MSRRLLAGHKLGLATSLADLGLSALAFQQLRDAGLHVVIDLASVTRGELVALPNIGPLTVERLRRILLALQLDFKPSADPMRHAKERSHLARLQAPAVRARRLSPASHIADLGLKWSTVRCCIRHDVTSVGQLLQMDSVDLRGRFDPRVLSDLQLCVGRAGLEFTPPPRSGPSVEHPGS